ncbi:MAG TPA: peptidylprolyl isomerase, partial [Chitinophagaceae bacterium]
MSIIQRIRDRAAWLIFGAIALAMIGFIVTDAFQGGGGGWFGSQPTTVAKINGEKIDYTVYQTRLAEAEERYRTTNDAEREMMQNQVWSQLVEETLLKDVFADLGFFVSDKEVNDMLYGPNPPDFIRQQLANPQTGEYDPNAVYQRLEQFKREQPQQFNAAMQGIIYMRMRQKYLALLENTVYVPKWLVEKANADNSIMTNASYVAVPYYTIPDSAVKVTDEDVKDYINKHKAQFKQEESRSIAYVSFSGAPSAKDTADVVQTLLNVKPEFDTTRDQVGFLARNGTETEYSDKFVTAVALQVPFKDSITPLPEGRIFGPYLDANTYVLAKMIAKRTMPDTVKVRHILIKGTDSVAKARIDSVKRVLESGGDWKIMAATVSEDEGSKNTGGEYTFNSIDNLAPEFYEAAFFGNKGDKKIITTQFGYHYIEVMDQKKIGPAYKVAYLSKPIIASTTTTDGASGLASQFSGQSRTLKAFDDNAAKNPSLQKIPVDNISPSGSEIPGL